MSAETIFYLFLGFYFAELFFSLWLSLLNTNHVLQHKDQPPTRYQDKIPPEKYKSHIEYTMTKSRFGRITTLFSSVVFLVFLFCGGFGYFDEGVRSFGFSSAWTGILFIYATSLFFSIFDLPFSLYSIFVIEEKFGFNKMTLKLFFLDMFKGLILSVILLTPILWILLWFMRTTGPKWWIYAFFIMLGFQLFILFIFPVLLAPLFNKFTPLNPGPLKEKIEELAEKISFKNSGIFVMDGSKRSGHGNAYFTGFGSSKRIVLYDTLLESLDEEQIVAVLAHEIGHSKLNHIKKSFVISSLFMLLSFYVLSLLVPYQPFYEAFSIQHASHAAAILLFSLCSGAFTFFLTPVFSALTRKHEYEADAYATQLTGPKNLSDALIMLDKDNLSNLWPHPWYSFFYYSHPTSLERIKAIEAKASA